MSVIALDRISVERFAGDLARVFDVEHGRLLVAVSGGPDSVALLLLAHRLLGARCRAATVDHGLRDQSAAEAAWVAGLCATIGVEHSILKAALPERVNRTRNLSSRARALRYRLLEEEAAACGATGIATAHHADDQVETLLMRLNRGAGLTGLAGVRARSGTVIRPLLRWRRADLAALVVASGIAPVDDPSNHDPRFDRARVRAAIAGASWVAPSAWTRSAEALADAEEALAWTADRLWKEHCREWDGQVSLSPADLPFDLQRRLVERCVRTVDTAADPRGHAVAAAVTSLEHGDTITLGNVLCRAARDAGGEPVWRFAKAPARRST